MSVLSRASTKIGYHAANSCSGDILAILPYFSATLLTYDPFEGRNPIPFHLRQLSLLPLLRNLTHGS